MSIRKCNFYSYIPKNPSLQKSEPFVKPISRIEPVKSIYREEPTVSIEEHEKPKKETTSFLEIWEQQAEEFYGREDIESKVCSMRSQGDSTQKEKEIFPFRDDRQFYYGMAIKQKIKTKF